MIKTKIWGQNGSAGEKKNMARDPESTQKGKGQVWVQILTLSFSNCAALSKFLQCSVPPFPHMKTHLVRRIREEEVGKAGWSAGQCLNQALSQKGLGVDGSLLPISMAGINLPTLADYKLSTGACKWSWEEMHDWLSSASTR